MEHYLRMKTLVCLLLLATAASAQNAPVPSRPQRVINQVAQNQPAAELSRFDLDFKGGPPAALVQAMSKALGKQVNVVVDESDAAVRLPPILVRSATVHDVFTAITMATAREVAVPVGGGNYQFRSVQNTFQPAGAISDDTVWSFSSNEADTQQNNEVIGKPERSLRHFQLSPYLNEKLTVEDITTAIRTGWEMMGEKDQPELKFHRETGILIAVGNTKLLEQIPQLLQQLPGSENAAGFGSGFGGGGGFGGGQSTSRSGRSTRTAPTVPRPPPPLEPPTPVPAPPQ